jgi:DNA-binding NtrC family response regulator
LLTELAQAQGLETLGVTSTAMEALALARWEQNVRELRSLVGRVAVFGTSPFVLDLPFLEREAPGLVRPRSVPPAAAPNTASRSTISREALEKALAEHDGRVVDVAVALGTSRTQVYRWLDRYGLAPPRGKK